MGGRPLASFASRGQQRTAILAFKLAELDLLTALDGRPPLLLLDDVFSELDPERRAHLVRRIAGAAAGVRDHDDARRPGPRPALGGHHLGGRRGARRHVPPRPGAHDRRATPSRPSGAAARRGSASCCPRPRAGWGWRTSCGSPARSRPGTPSSPSGCRRPSVRAGWRRSSRTRSSCAWTSPSWRRSCASAPSSCWVPSRPPREARECASCASGWALETLPGRARAHAYNRDSRRRADGIPSRHRRIPTRVAPTMRLVAWPSVSS